MRRQPIVKSLTVVAALSACAVAAPTAFASTGYPLPDTSKAVVLTGQDNHIAPPDTSKAVVLTGQDNHIAPPDTSKAVVLTGQDNHIAPPDTSKAVVVTQQPSSSSNDLRSPDAKAAAADPRTQTYATPTVIKVGSDSGFDWGDAGIGAGGALAVVALAGGGLVLVSRRRTTHPRVSPTAG
jgi:hypothetical protein